MNSRKLLTSAVAAATIAGTIGLAYAQSTDPATSSTPSSAQTAPSTSGEAAQPAGTLPPTDSTQATPTTPAPMAPAPMNQAPSSQTPSSESTVTPAPSGAAPMDSELAPKADRN